MREQLLEVFRNWPPEMQLTVKVRFVRKESYEPVTGEQYVVRLYDKDFFTEDDHLATAKLSAKGEAHLSFYPSDIRNHDLGFEELPDLYLLLFDGDVVHFQSNVWSDVDFEKMAMMDMKEGEVLNFGTFLVD